MRRFHFISLLLLPVSMLSQHATDSLHTNLFVRTAVKFSPDYSISYQHIEYTPLEDRWGMDYGIGIDFRLARHFYLQAGLERQTSYATFRDKNENYYAATGVFTYSLLNLRYSYFHTYLGLAVPYGWNKFYIRPGATAGLTTGNSFLVKDLLDDSKEQKKLGDSGMGSVISLSLQAGYRLNHSLTAWCGYTWSKGGSLTEGNSHPATPNYSSNAGGNFHAFTATISVNLLR